ncbi:hypothetical protein pb186bvf_021195 [Paramecium bursaria]
MKIIQKQISISYLAQLTNIKVIDVIQINNLSKNLRSEKNSYNLGLEKQLTSEVQNLHSKEMNYLHVLINEN